MGLDSNPEPMAVTTRLARIRALCRRPLCSKSFVGPLTPPTPQEHPAHTPPSHGHIEPLVVSKAP